MTTIAVVLTFLTFGLGASELMLAEHDGVPGRRVGGGTRHDTPSVSRVTDA